MLIPLSAHFDQVGECYLKRTWVSICKPRPAQIARSFEKLDIVEAIPPLQCCAEANSGKSTANAGKLAVVALIRVHFERENWDFLRLGMSDFGTGLYDG